MGGPTSAGGLSIPRQSLLAYIRPPGTSEDLGWDEDDAWVESATWFNYALPVEVFAAVGVGPWFTDEDTPITRTMAEILADPSTNQYHILASARRGVAVYDPYTVWLNTITKAQKYFKATPDLSSLIVWTQPFTDSIGANTRPLYDLQYWAGGTGIHVSILAGTTETHSGTGSVSVAAGVLTFTGVVFDMLLSNGSFYPCGSTDAGVLWDVSGNGNHLVYAGGSCGSGKEHGSDWLNQAGVTISDGATQYMSAISFGLIPVDTVIPALSDGSGCCAFVVGG